MGNTLKSSAATDFFVDDDGTNKGIVSRGFGFVKGLMYYLTELEKLRPSAPPTESITRDYRLFQLEETTPTKMYLRKIDDGEYGEALQVAYDFGLDTDLVYQRRWEMSSFYKNDIDDFLRKITKRSYINEEVLNRIPSNIDHCRELLKFGLRGNDIYALRDRVRKN